jgi:hypothetical protein
MSFYYGSSQPPDGDKPGSLKEALAMTWVVFSLLAKPFAFVVAGLAYLFLLFWAFNFHALAGVTAIALPLAAVAARGLWEWRHPPELK